METGKDNIRNVIRLLQHDVKYPYRETLFKELDAWKKFTKSDKVNFYWADLHKHKLYARENADCYVPCDFLIDYPGNVCGVAAYFKEIYVIDDITKMGLEWRHNVKVEHIKASSVICVPILDSKQNVLGVVELYREIGSAKYSEFIIGCMKDTAFWMGIVLEQSINSAHHKYVGDILKDSSKNLTRYINDQISFLNYTSSILPILKRVVGAEEVLLYEIDKEHSMDVYYGTPLTHRRLKELTNSFRFVKLIANSKEMFKITLEENDKRITNEFLTALKIKIKNLFLLPILSGDSLLAVLQFVNHKYDDEFTMEVLQNVLKFFTVGLQVKRLKDLHVVSSACNEIYLSRLKIQAMRSCDLTTKLNNAAVIEDIGEFYCYPKRIEDIAPMVMHMFQKVCGGLVQEESLQNFVIAVKNCHREDLPFHNVFQSCDAANTMFSIIIRNREFFKDYEILALLICSYLYAIDGSGLSNFIMEYTKHPLTTIYLTSYKQKNRKSLGLFLIEKTDLLSHLPQDIQEKVLKLFKNIMRLEKNYGTTAYRVRLEKSFLSRDRTDWPDSLRAHWLEFLVWCAYHSRHTNEFRISRALTEAVYKEYFANGDILKKYGLRPKPNQTREYGDRVLEYEVKYISETLLPGYKLLKEIFPSTHELYDAAEKTMENYQDACELKGKPAWYVGISIGLSK